MDNSVLNIDIIINMIGDIFFTPLIWVTIISGFVIGFYKGLEYGQSSLKVAFLTFITAAFWHQFFPNELNFLVIFIYSLSLGVLLCYTPWWFQDWYNLFAEIQNGKFK